jgi:phytanoyl-CoA hydroxylase
MSSAVAELVNEKLVEDFRRNGFCVAKGLFTADDVSILRDTFMKMNENGPVPGLSEMRHTGESAYQASDPLSFYPRMMHPHKHPEKPVGPVAMRFMLHERIEAILTALMGEEPYAVQSMFYFKPPGARGQDFHQDNFYLRVKPGTCMAAWVALDRCDADNGGMMCVPETQDYAIQCPEKADSKLYFTTEHVAIPEGKTAVLPIMEPGDVLFFNGSTIHGSGPNTSKDRFRRSFICHYAPKSTTEMSHWYDAIYDFKYTPKQIAKNNDGGPCGTLQESVVIH